MPTLISEIASNQKWLSMYAYWLFIALNFLSFQILQPLDLQNSIVFTQLTSPDVYLLLYHDDPDLHAAFHPAVNKLTKDNINRCLM